VAGLVQAGWAGHGNVGPGKVRMVAARFGWLGVVCSGVLQLGAFWLSRLGEAGSGSVRHG